MKILVTGSNGFVGNRLVKALAASENLDLIATSLHPPVHPLPANVVFESLDLTNRSVVGYILDRYQPGVVVHTAAMSGVDACELDPASCWKINVHAVEYLAEACRRNGSKLIHLSSDFVFDGLRGPYAENDLPNPVNQYGRSKWESEQILANLAGKWAVVRTILVYGAVSENEKPDFVRWVCRGLLDGKSLRVVSDQFRMPTWIGDLVEGIRLIIDREAEGIYHLSGAEMLSVYDFAREIAGVFDLDTSGLLPVPSADLQAPAMRPPSTGFILDKAVRDLGYAPHSIHDILSGIRAGNGPS